MDPFSQAVLGAAVAHGCCGRKLGWKAAAWGALAGAAPDIDILFGIGGDEFDRLQSHRGITHALIFAPVVGPIWGWLLDRRERKRGAPADPTQLRAWIAAITLALWSHPLLDYFTPYGTQLLLPFSDARFASGAMPIIDPVYTGILGAALFLAWRLRAGRLAIWASWAGLALSCTYIAWAWQLNEAAVDFARADLAARGVHDAAIRAYPTVLQIHYRRVVARTPTTDYAGFISLWDPCPIDWGNAPRRDDAFTRSLATTREGRIFDWFAMGMATAFSELSSNGRSVRVIDLRYGTSNDPLQSIFSLEAILDEAGNVLSATMRQFPDNAREVSLDGLFERAYAVCRG
ncbi:MAG: metal-dependent hydrolase [Gammaproteobacteria bacterium]|nr:metal-dependent hydrolase [Gammaproteobacteria bacterium]